jgi:hypothetical protein
MRTASRALSAFALLLAACGGIDGPATIENTSFAGALGVNLAASTKIAGGEYYRDLTPGTGAVVSTGQTVSAHYTGWLPNGLQFDSNAGAEAFTFHLGAAEVIAGWDQGWSACTSAAPGSWSSRLRWRTGRMALAPSRPTRSWCSRCRSTRRSRRAYAARPG